MKLAVLNLGLKIEAAMTLYRLYIILAETRNNVAVMILF